MATTEVTTERNTGTVTLRCTTTAGVELAQLTIDTKSTFAASALQAVIGDRETGSVTASSFARIAFGAVRDYEGQPGLRAKVTLRHLRALDALALAAVTRDITATITWS